MNSQNIIIGTCGHIDHGKSSVVKALSGIDGDNTPEEKKRGITIDLSFIHIKAGERILSFIDVPGHESLVKNMIAGAYGFDYAMLVVAANEGLKPQSMEHLWILELLGIKNLLIVVSKCDLVEGAEAISLSIQKEISERFAFNIIKTIHFSIFDFASISHLKEVLVALPKAKNSITPFFRMYLDRVFSIKGSGTVVTGTIIGGEIKIGDKLKICDTQKQISVKSIQKYGDLSQSAYSGERVALNLSGVLHHELQKGMQIVKKGFLRGFYTIDVWIDSKTELHNKYLFIYIGTKRLEVKIISLEDGYATLHSNEPIFAIFGERFVIRDGSETLGGGEVLNPIADPMKKRQKIALLYALKKRDFSKAFGILIEIHKKGFGIISVQQRFGISQSEALEILLGLEGIFVDDKDMVAFSEKSAKVLQEKVRQVFQKNRYAMLSAKSLKERFNYASEAFCQDVLEALEKDGLIRQNGSLYVSVDCELKNLDQYLEDSIFAELSKGGIVPLAPYNIYDKLDIDRLSGDSALKRLTKSKKVLRLEHNFFITLDHLQEAISQLRDIIKENGYVDVALCKEKMHISRKYAIALLEYLDQFGDIKKEGQKRISV